ncbi:MAG: hypothetical protein A3G97_05755 [Candidatus Rokubacteria bacterium RIFCSPLOWO2_12_FULL_69_21]|nr:MAG: hypothetical protein A3G97_05755 [Candidatus Rokubacteria bacterium RIFCSPLOWO2_12_FULL_69_21]
MVALEEDRGRLPFVEANPRFSSPRQAGPFLVFALKEKMPTLELKVDLVYWNGSWESVGVVLTALALISWGGTAFMMRGRL